MTASEDPGNQISRILFPMWAPSDDTLINPHECHEPKTIKFGHYLSGKTISGQIIKWDTKKKLTTFPLYWLVNKDPFNGLL